MTRDRPLCFGDNAYLTEETQEIFLPLFFHYFSVNNLIDRDASPFYFFARCRNAQKTALIGSGKTPAYHDLVVFSDLFLNIKI